MYQFDTKSTSYVLLSSYVFFPFILRVVVIYIHVVVAGISVSVSLVDYIKLRSSVMVIFTLASRGIGTSHSSLVSGHCGVPFGH